MPIIYDSSAGQYRGDNGRFISRSRVLEVVEGETLALQARLQSHVKKAIRGKIDAATLAKNMSQDLKIASIQSAAMAKGGVKRLTFSDYGKIGKAQQERNKRIRSLVDGLISGTVSEKQALQRAAQYAGTIKQIHSVVEHSEQSQYYNQAKRILTPGVEHCNECIGFKTNGWINAAEVIPIGSQCSCRQNCKCVIMYRNFRSAVLAA
jgi:hypothetical protein